MKNYNIYSKIITFKVSIRSILLAFIMLNSSISFAQYQYEFKNNELIKLRNVLKTCLPLEWRISRSDMGVSAVDNSEKEFLGYRFEIIGPAKMKADKPNLGAVRVITVPDGNRVDVDGAGSLKGVSGQVSDLPIRDYVILYFVPITQLVTYKKAQESIIHKKYIPNEPKDRSPRRSFSDPKKYFTSQYLTGYNSKFIFFSSNLIESIESEIFKKFGFSRASKMLLF